MNKIIILALILILATRSYSQDFLNSTKSVSKKSLLAYGARENLRTIISETDTGLVFLLRDPKMQNLDIILHFDTIGKCDRELRHLYCDSCYHKFLNSTLSNKYYRWTSVDSNTYFARFPYRLILTTGPDTSFSFLTRRSALPGNEYRRTVRNALNQKTVDE